MKENTNYKKIGKLLKTNGGIISRYDLVNNNINTWFLYDYAKKNNLTKIKPGVFASSNFVNDEYFSFQQRYKSFIYSGYSALYLLGLTNRIPDDIEVACLRGYHPFKTKPANIDVHYENNAFKHEFNIINRPTIFGNSVKTYGYERMFCELVKNRKKYDSETFLYAITKCVRNNLLDYGLVYEYAKAIRVDEAVYNLLEVILNEH